MRRWTAQGGVRERSAQTDSGGAMGGMFHTYIEKAGGQGKINHLFLCHFLSTWNARSYEFAATLFVAAAFPDGLSFMSWGGITISLAIIFFASTLGRWIDSAPSRLRILLTSIFFNRIVVILGCICWAILLAQGHPETLHKGGDPAADTDSEVAKLARVKFRLFLVIIVLGVFERLSRIATLLSVERDWVPNLALLETEGKDAQIPQDLAHLNAVMSRIDLVCKLISPIVVAHLVASANSPQFGPWSLVVINLITWPLEYWTARKVWSENASLQQPKQTAPVVIVSDHEDRTAQRSTRRALDWTLRAALHAIGWFAAYVQSLKQYFSTDVWMPSVAMTSLHFSVLAFSGILTVFLIQSGFSVRLIMWGEVVSAIFELSSTFVFPWGVRFFSARAAEYVALHNGEEGYVSDGDDALEDIPGAVDQSIGASKLGLWSLGQMLVVLVSLLLLPPPVFFWKSIDVPV